MTIADWWNTNIAPLLTQPEAAGTAGSLLTLRWAPGKTWWVRFSAVFAGLAIVLFVMPAVAEFYSIQSPRYLLALGFFMGFSGPYLLATFLDFVRELKWRQIVAIALNLKPGGK